MLKIKRTNLESEYEVVGHKWDAYGDGNVTAIYIHKSCDDGSWTETYSGSRHTTLLECKWFLFEMLNTNGEAA
jgi:hypothetical protein